MDRPPRPSRDAYRWFTALQTRWLDNDMYGHVNNVHYYSFFDTGIAHFLIGEAGFDPAGSPFVDFAIETGCRFHQPLVFPDRVDCGIRIARLGNSSCRWEIGLFRNDEDEAAADGHFVHVFVDRESQRPIAIPPAMRTALERILVA